MICGAIFEFGFICTFEIVRVITGDCAGYIAEPKLLVFIFEFNLYCIDGYRPFRKSKKCNDCSLVLDLA